VKGLAVKVLPGLDLHWSRREDGSLENERKIRGAASPDGVPTVSDLAKERERGVRRASVP